MPLRHRIVRDNVMIVGPIREVIELLDRAASSASAGLALAETSKNAEMAVPLRADGARADSSRGSPQQVCERVRNPRWLAWRDFSKCWKDDGGVSVFQRRFSA